MSEQQPTPTSETHWAETAKGLFLAGFSYNEISERLNQKPATVRQRARRGKWMELRATVRDTALACASDAPIADQSAAVRKLLASDLVETAKSLKEIPRSNRPKDARARQEVVNAIALGSEKVFQWDQVGAGKCTIDIHMLATPPDQWVEKGYLLADPEEKNITETALPDSNTQPPNAA